MNSAVKILIGGAFVLTLAPGSIAAAFPDGPINVTVCTPAGGGNDRTIRAVEQVAAKHFGQPFTIGYREGAGGTLAMQDLVGAQPDGYNLTFCDNGGAILAPIAQGLDLGPDSVIPLGQLAFIPWVFTARTDSGIADVATFVEKAGAADGAFQAPITSIAGADHYVWMLFARESGIGVNGLQWTPFGGGGPKLRALIAGESQIDMMLPSLVREHVNDGTMKVIATASNERLSDFPDSPTFKELGFDVIDGLSIVLYAPPGTPQDRVDLLRKAIADLKTDPELKALYDNLGQSVDDIDSSDAFLSDWRSYWESARAMLSELTK
jgi:tripartite-type tricarboxylate transporter receptor subunit TctC